MKYFFALLFLLFALVQYNDPDGWLWALAYLNIAVVVVLPPWAYKKAYVMLCLGLYGLWTLSFMPDFWHWIQLGSPSITGTMKAENPEIELVREFLGLVIGDAVLVYVWLTLKKTGESVP